MQHRLLSASPGLPLSSAHEPTVLSEQVYAIPINNQRRKSIYDTFKELYTLVNKSYISTFFIELIF